MPVPAPTVSPILSSDLPYLHTDFRCIQFGPFNQIISVYRATNGGIVWNDERMWKDVVVVVYIIVLLPDPSPLTIHLLPLLTPCKGRGKVHPITGHEGPEGE